MQVEYISYLSKKAEKRQNAIVTLSDQSHRELEELQRQRQIMQNKHQEKTNGKTSVYVYVSVLEMKANRVIRFYCKLLNM